MLRARAPAWHVPRFWLLWAVLLAARAVAQESEVKTTDQSPENEQKQGGGGIAGFFSRLSDLTRGGDEEKEGEEEPPPQRDVGIACMLLGSVAFVMLLFYVVNWKDDDIRLYAWGIISTTLSIFTAVLSFSGIRSIVFRLLPISEELGSAEVLEIVRAYSMYLVLFLLLQLAVKIVSGAYCDCCCPVDLEAAVWVVADNLRADFGDGVPEEWVRNRTGNRSVAVIDNVEVFVEKRHLNMEKTKRRLKAWAMMMAHLCGFAAIEAGGSLQHLEVFARSPLMALVAAVINQVVIVVLFRLFDLCRQATIYDHEDERVVMCKEEIFDAELDIISLATSFLTVQVVRYAITGTLPNEEGLVEPWKPVGYPAILQLLGFGVASLVVSILFVCIKCSNEFLKFVVELSQNTFGLLFAWSALWSSRLFMREWDGIDDTLGTDLYTNERHLVTALVLSLCALLVIKVLDCVSDMGGGVTRTLQNMINVLSVMIGLSWESCFESGVSELSQETPNPFRMQLVFSAGAIAIVLPAWRWYVLQRVLDLDRKRQERCDAQAGGDARDVRTKPEDDEAEQELLDAQDADPKAWRSSGFW
eukprot:TRINITY_DN61574_c0_g1_i1.p1 TRINITY_DN61574_c0_g1~~TRINITY_DN61574_c0_g1_i1.p1  ORF type:complete len:600 (-),score=112.15 TRINITY_DN61574_c0_g1_i1:113-1870(-)